MSEKILDYRGYDMSQFYLLAQKTILDMMSLYVDETLSIILKKEGRGDIRMTFKKIEEKNE